MPRNRVEAVRQPLPVAVTSRRTLEQQLVRFPLVVKFLARLLWGLWLLLPPASRLRKAMARHYIKGCLEALNRGDLEAAFALFHPNVQSTWDGRSVPIGIEPVAHGWKARFDLQRCWNAEWRDWQFRPRELIDLCDGRLLITGQVKGIGLSSGIAVDQHCDFLYTISGGLAIREQIFLDDHSEALAAAGQVE
jgi:ketosteroid isomerase-like protein